MSWSIQIGKVLGIPIRLHITFLLLMGWLAWSMRGNPINVLLPLGLFACVLAHELGHAMVARRYGVEVTDITLLPIGGLARMPKIPREPVQELWIAAAGPAVNFVLAPLLFLGHLLLEPRTPAADIWSANGLVLLKLAWLNLSLGLFNLLPAFPMDGGRILRAFLALRMPYVKATQFASSLGQLAAFGMGFVGLTTSNPILILVAFFIFLGAAEEGSRVQTQAFTQDVPVKDAMVRQFSTLRRGDSLGHAADLLLEGTQHDFPVVEGEDVVGILTRGRLIQALSESGRDPYVSEVMEPAPASVSPDELLLDVLERMAAGGLTLVPVKSEEGLCGLVTTDNTAEYVLVRAALLKSANAHAAR